MSKSWPTPSSDSPLQAEELSGRPLLGNPDELDAACDESAFQRVGRNWHLMVLPGLMGLMVWMVATLLWPQPQAEITLKPLSGNTLSDAYTLTAEESSVQDEAMGTVATSETEAEAAAESGAVSAGKAVRKKHPRSKAYPKKSAHPPVTNLNTASLAQLQRLPGIGPKMAQRIVDYRKSHGPFATPEQVMDVKGIGPKKFEKLKAFLKV